MEAMARTAGGDLTGAIASAAAGDELAFRRIIAAYHEDLRRVCSYVTRDEAIAEDAVQAAWTIVWRRIGSVREPPPWLVSVAVNEAKQLLRKRRRRAEIEVITDASGEPGGIDPATGIALIDLRAAMARLDTDERALLAMRYVAGFDSTELGAAIGITPSGVRNRLERLLEPSGMQVVCKPCHRAKTRRPAVFESRGIEAAEACGNAVSKSHRHEWRG
jgi:RNA polymerase sigma-70 factor (ECF subfamily)